MIQYRPDIDGLRTVAVFSVLLYHLDFSLFSGGFVGVDVFFVISGFLITNIIATKTSNGNFSFSNFYLRRFRRLAPALIVCLLVTLLVSAFLMPPTKFQRVGGMAFSGLFSFANVFLWLEADYFDAASKFKPLLHTWSLSVEEQFYLVWPILIFTLIKVRKWIHPVFVLMPFFIISLILAEYNLSSRPSAVFFLTPFRFYEFAVGGLLFWMKPYELKSPEVRNGLFLLGLAMIVFSVIQFGERTAFPGYNALIPCIGAAFCIFSQPKGILGGVLGNSAMARLGQWSYSIYLVHWPLIVFYRYGDDSELSMNSKLLLLSVSVFLAVLLYYFIEQPLRTPKPRKIFKKHSDFKVFFGPSVALLIVLSISVWGTNGWSWRANSYDAFLNEQNTSPKDFHKKFYGGHECKPPRCSSTMIDQKNKVYVLGDSYARAYYAGFKKVYPNIQFIFWENAGCEFFSEGYVGSHTKSPGKCMKVKMKAYLELKNTKYPVFLGQHWYSNFKEELLIQEGFEGVDVKFTSIDEYARFVVEQVRSLEKHLGVGKLVLLGGPPKFGLFGTPIDCVLTPFGKKKCDKTPYNETTLWHKKFYEALIENGWPSERFLNPYPFLCDDKFCKNFVDNKYPVYSDYGHLSIWGSEYLVSAFKSKLDVIIRNEATSFFN